MQQRTIAVCVATLLFVLSATVGCGSDARSSATQTICDGISSDVGGCTTERHGFAGSSCAGLAEEWATELDGQIVEILEGPDSVADQGRSVRIRQALVVTTVDMNTRLTELALQADCDVPEFMAAAEARFSETLRAGAGDALYDGDPSATYEEWLQDVRNVVRMIDDGE